MCVCVSKMSFYFAGKHHEPYISQFTLSNQNYGYCHAREYSNVFIITFSIILGSRHTPHSHACTHTQTHTHRKLLIPNTQPLFVFTQNSLFCAIYYLNIMCICVCSRTSFHIFAISLRRNRLV